MERIITVHVRKLPQGPYLVTSDDLQELIAQGETAADALDIARDVANRLLESQKDLALPEVPDEFDQILIV
jgi:predicted RNase H-like HicB family nuclease